MNIEKASSSEVWTEAQGENIDKENAGDDKSSDSSDDDDSGEGNDVQKQIAPLELMGEVWPPFPPSTNGCSNKTGHIVEVNVERIA